MGRSPASRFGISRPPCARKSLRQALAAPAHLFVITLTLLLAACNGGGVEPPAFPAATMAPGGAVPPGPTRRPVDPPTPAAEPLLVAESAGITTSQPRATIDTGRVNLTANSGFDGNTSGWDRPYGTLRYSTSTFQSPPGSARLVTTDSSEGLDYRGTVGQCIDLTPHLEGWPESSGEEHLRLEAQIQTDGRIASAMLNGLFSDDPRCGPGHVGDPVTVTTGGNQEWGRVAAQAAIPEGARSVDVFIWANGLDETGTVYIDDVLAYSPD